MGMPSTILPRGPALGPALALGEGVALEEAAAELLLAGPWMRACEGLAAGACEILGASTAAGAATGA